MASIKTDLFEQIKQAIMAMPVDDPFEEDHPKKLQASSDEDDSSPVEHLELLKDTETESTFWDSGGDLSSPNTTMSEEESEDEKVLKAYEIRPQGPKGLGMFAARDIAPITIICQERPILVCPAGATSPAEMERHMLDAMKGLLPADRDFILHCLVNANNDPHHLAGCYRTNALPCGRDSDRGAIFKHLAMVNHSCTPNAEYCWDGGKEDGSGRSGVLHALEPIGAGTEITISYVDPAPHEMRRAQLREAFGFACDCALCGLSHRRRRAEDARIREIEGLELTLFSDPRHRLGPAAAAAAPADTLRRFADLAALYQQSEVSHQRDLLRLYASVVQLCVASFDVKTAVGEIVRVCGMTKEAAFEAYRDWYDDNDYCFDYCYD